MIRGKRCRLRPVEEADYPLILTWQNQPVVFFQMDYERPFSLEDIRASEARAREEGHPFIIEVEGRPIGRIGLNRFRVRDRICSLYAFIGEPDYWGKGYGTDAVRTLVAYAFENLNLHQIELWALEGNERAFRCYEKSGFVREAVLRNRSYKNGRWYNRVYFVLTRTDFIAAQREWECASDATTRC